MNQKILHKKPKTIYTFVIIAATSNSNISTVTGFGLLVKPVPIGVPCGFFLSNKVHYELF